MMLLMSCFGGFQVKCGMKVLDDENRTIWY